MLFNLLNAKMMFIRKAILNDLDFLIKADLSGEGYAAISSEMTAEEQVAHRKKIANFVQDGENHGAWIYEDTEVHKPVAMILCRFRKRPLKGVEEYPNDMVFHQFEDSIFPADGRFCEVFQLWVEPDYRRRGLGTRLKEQLEIESRHRGIGMIYTHTETQNQHVLELNFRLGYKEVRRGPIWDDTPRVSLVKHLA